MAGAKLSSPRESGRNKTADVFIDTETIANTFDFSDFKKYDRN